MNHLPVLPILIPLIAGATILLVERRGMVVQRAIAWTSLAALLAVVVAVFARASEGTIDVYLIGDWPARLGITLVVDRLTAMMLLTVTLLAMACLLHGCAGWDRRAPHFHALFQLQLMGLNGAFLTGDLFNLFVFFEVMLIASYGLMVSGGRGPRLRASLHYVVFNITASTLFLIALALLYGMLGTLNMAEMATRISQAAEADQALIQAAAGILLVVFCAKAALLPLYLWLPRAYARAPATVAALFVVMTKVGLYSIVRVYTLLFGTSAGALAGFAWDWLLPAGIATLAMGALGVLASTSLRRVVSYLVLVSAATLFIAFSLAQPGTIAAGLYYLMHSTFIAAALFLLVDLIRRHRGRQVGDNLPERAPFLGNATLVGIAYLIAAVSVTGLPPLSGFVGKLMLLESVPASHVGLVWTVVLVSSLMVIVALTRAGTQVFWRIEDTPRGAKPPKPRPLEKTAIGLLLAYGIALTLAAGPALRYTQATAEQLLAPENYIGELRDATPLLRSPSP